jgi:hypothetical protein
VLQLLFQESEIDRLGDELDGAASHNAPIGAMSPFIGAS